MRAKFELPIPNISSVINQLKDCLLDDVEIDIDEYVQICDSIEISDLEILSLVFLVLKRFRTISDYIC